MSMNANGQQKVLVLPTIISIKISFIRHVHFFFLISNVYHLFMHGAQLYRLLQNMELESQIFEKITLLSLEH